MNSPRQEPMKVVIQRERWARGGINGTSSLLNELDCMCCLGFAAKQIGGFRDDEIRDQSSHPKGQMWDGELRFLDDEPEHDYMNDGRIADRFIRINDSRGYREERREDVLTEEFAKHGIELEFE